MSNVYLAPTSGPAPFALGCMNFGKRTEKADALRILDRAFEAGVGLFDTANVYTDGESERIVGQAARGKDVLVASKVGLGRAAGRSEGLAPGTIHAACDASLKRLGRDWIDLYYLHAPDHGTPIADTLGAVAELLAAGKIRSWGVSNFASWQILEARLAAAELGMAPPAVAQQLYNVLVRQLDVEYFRFAERYPIHTTVYNPLAGGLLVGKLAEYGAVPRGSRFDGNALYRRRYWHHALFEGAEELAAIASAEGMSLVGLAYAYVRSHPGVHSVLVGPGAIEHLEAALLAPTDLSPQARTAIDGVYTELVGTDARYAR